MIAKGTMSGPLAAGAARGLMRPADGLRGSQRAGLICCRPGATTVLDRRELEAVACECYRIVRQRYEGLLAQAFD